MKPPKPFVCYPAKGSYPVSKSVAKTARHFAKSGSIIMNAVPSRNSKISASVAYCALERALRFGLQLFRNSSIDIHIRATMEES